jgi:hypothetical protein
MHGRELTNATTKAHEQKESHMRTSSKSRFRRAVEWIKSFWDEVDYAQRRLLEIQTGRPIRKRPSR